MTAVLALDDLLKPVSGARPGGADLRYDPEDPTYSRIREARRPDEEDTRQGRVPKVADSVVIELASEAIRSKSKDLQLAVWLTDSLIHREGYAGLEQGLELILRMIELFWDCLHPAPDDGDLEMRAAPLDWMGSYFELAKESCPVLSVRLVPITEGGLTWLDYQHVKTGDDSDKTGGFEAAFVATDREFYERRVAELAGCLEKLIALDRLCGDDTRFGKAAPSFTRLRATLEQIQGTVTALLKRKPAAKPRAAEPAKQSPAPSAEGMPEAAVATAVTGLIEEFSGEIAGIEPQHKHEAIVRIAAAARYLRRLDPSNPAPYLVIRALRWAELRAGGSELDTSLLVAPATEVRTRMRTLAANGHWSELLELTESAATTECGRGWLDLHRYAATACEKLGYTAAARAMKSELACLLADYPTLGLATLLDDTGAANPETAAWLKRELKIESQ